MSAKDKHGMSREFERTVNFLGDALSNRETTHKIWKFKTCDDEADIETDDKIRWREDLSPGTSSLASFFRLFKNNDFCATETSFEEPPAGDGARG